MQALFGQLLIGLINGAFYAMLSLGLAVIFGLLNIINFSHGAQYMMGAFCAWFLLNHGIAGVSLGYWPSLIIAPVAVGITGIVIERTMLARLYLATWYVIERTKLGSYLRAATENPALVQAFGINVPRMVTLTFGFGVALAALAGVMAAPIYQVNPLMGADLIIVVFAVVVIGGMGSILGAILTGFGLGIVEGLTKYFYPEASTTVIFVIMVLVLLVRPAGLFGKER
jgi:branched-chain amino acid transport system permease protein